MLSISNFQFPIFNFSRRAIRKHWLSFVLAATYLLVLYFPMIFMGRVLSPNDVFYHYEPWATVRHAEAQNPVLNDPPASYLTLMSLLKDDPSSFHWNRYTGSGIPGFGSAAAAVLSPLIALPTLLLPLSAVYAGIIALKFLGGYVLAYWWLREERLGKRGAAVGALLFSAAGAYVVWWLWQGTNATVLYPAVLLLLTRMFHGKRNSIALMAVLGVALLLSGFPATIAYIAYLAVLYFLYLCIRERRIPILQAGHAAAALLVAALIAAPFLAPFVSLIRRSGYLPLRVQAGYDFHYPVDHLRGFIDPYRLGDPTSHLWIGDARLAISNNFIESTIYHGWVALLLIPIGLAASRAQHRWFWAGLLLILILVMFGAHHPLKDSIGELPGLKYSPLTRLRVLLPLPIAYLGAAAVSQVSALAWRRKPRRWVIRAAAAVVPLGIGVVAAVNLALFAGRFFPFIDPRLTTLPATPTIQFLHSQRGPFRVAPFFLYLWPNSAELVRLEDIRSHFGSEQRYRDLLLRFDPGSWGGSGTVIQFNGLRANIADSVLAMLNVRYLIEQLNIDIIRWRILEKTELNATPVGEVRVTPAAPLTRQLHVDRDDLYAVDVNFAVARSFRPDSFVEAELIQPETGRAVYRQRWSSAQLQKDPKVYIPVWRHARNGNVLLLHVQVVGMEALIPTTRKEKDPPLLYGKVKAPVIPLKELPDGRIFQNLAELPRHWAVWNVRQLAPHEILTAPVDFAHEAIVGSPPDESLTNLVKVAPWLRRVEVRLLKYSGAEQVVETRSDVPFLLATSEKLTPELRIGIDGQSVSPIEINGLFAAVRVGPGTHRIELTRRIGRGWWIPASVGLLLWIGTAMVEKRWLKRYASVGASASRAWSDSPTSW